MLTSPFGLSAGFAADKRNRGDTKRDIRPNYGKFICRGYELVERERQCRKLTGVEFTGETSLLGELLKVRLAVQSSIYLGVIAYLPTWYERK